MYAWQPIATSSAKLLTPRHTPNGKKSWKGDIRHGIESAFYVPWYSSAVRCGVVWCSTSSGKQIISQFAFNVFSLINVPIRDCSTMSIVEVTRSTHEHEHLLKRKWHGMRARVTEFRLQIDKTTSSRVTRLCARRTQMSSIKWWAESARAWNLSFKFIYLFICIYKMDTFLPALPSYQHSIKCRCNISIDDAVSALARDAKAIAYKI